MNDSRMIINNPNLCSRILKWLLIAILLYALLSWIICVCAADFYNIIFPARFATIGYFLALSIIFILFSKVRFKSLKWALPFGFILANFIMSIILLTFNSRPVSDSANIFDVAQQITNGSFNASEQDITSYTNLFNWQTGLGWFESVIFRLIGRPSITALKIVNLFCLNATLYLTYLLCKRLTTVNIARIAFVLLSSFYPFLVCVGQLYTCTVALPLVLAFILLLLNNRYFVAGCLLPIIHFIKPFAPLLVCVVIILFLYRLIYLNCKIKGTLKDIVSFFAPYLFLTFLINLVCIKTDLATGNISDSKIPYFKFYQGISITEWKNPIQDIEEHHYSLEEYNAEIKKRIIYNYTHRTLPTLGIIMKKMTMFLGSFDWRFAYTYNMVVPEFNHSYLTHCVAFGWAEYGILLILALCGAIPYLRQNRFDAMTVTFVLYICVHIFIEAWPSYRYDIYPFLVIFSAVGIEWIYRNVPSRFSRFRKSRSVAISKKNT